MDMNEALAQLLVKGHGQTKSGIPNSAVGYSYVKNSRLGLFPEENANV